MLLRHKKYPAAQINLPTGGALVFDNFECVVLPHTLVMVGVEFFNALIARDAVALVGKLTVEEYFEKATGVDSPNVEEEATDVTNLEKKDEVKNEKPAKKKKTGKSK